MTDLPGPLVDVAWLQARLGNEDLVLLDASVPPVVPGFESINADGVLRVIPGALRFDYDQQICDPDSSLPHMMPGPALFQDEMRKLGIDNDSCLIVYDDVGIYASPRAWWMLRAMGQRRVAVLDGGLPAWIDAGGATEKRHGTASRAGDFTVREEQDGFCDFEAVLQAIEDPGCTILDARSAKRFHGLVSEPRPNLRSGHMPTARNLPFAEVLDGHYMKSLPELRSLLRPLVEPGQALITSCGSGITACVLTLAAELAGYERLRVYDGSWAEWGMPSKLPVVTD